MKCVECDKQAIGICRWCLLGQCEDHMRAAMEARDRFHIMGCLHHFPEPNGSPRRQRSDAPAVRT